MPSHAYALLTVPFLFGWILFFFFSPKIRRPMAAMSGLAGLAGPISEFWHCRDYWHPDYLMPVTIGPWRFGLEDYALNRDGHGPVRGSGIEVRMGRAGSDVLQDSVADGHAG